MALKAEIPYTLSDAAFEGRIPEGCRTLILGVHRVIIPQPPPFTFRLLLPDKALIHQIESLRNTLKPVQWLFGQLYHLGPIAYPTILGFELVQSLLPTVELYLTNRMLNLIERGFRSGSMDVQGVLLAFGSRVTMALVEQCLYWASETVQQRMEVRAKDHFHAMTMRASLAQAYANGPDHDEDKNETRYGGAWNLFERLLHFSNTSISALGETSFLYWTLSKAENKWLAPVLCLTWIMRAIPAFASTEDRFWTHGFIAWVTNKDYLQMQAVNHISTTKKYRQEVLGLNLDQYIMEEYRNKSSQLTDVDTGNFYDIIQRTPFQPFQSLATYLLDQMPTLYYVFTAVSGRPSLSFAAVSSVQSASARLRWRFIRLFGSGSHSLPETLENIRNFYESTRLPPDPDEGTSIYPPPTCPSAGMALEFREVTFAYSGSKSTRPAVTNLSFSILPGQLVVIVGPNGSGKTSLVKLLTRMYEPTSGIIMVDHQPAKGFNLRQLREATAVLSQDHEYFRGLSVAENVGLGRWRKRGQMNLINDSLKLGGADGFVRKLKEGTNMVIHPLSTKRARVKHKFGKFYDQLEKEGDLSGGEKQRLVAARTFLRMQTGDPRLVVVDEPSAAMDPAGEYELFKNLREAREGKTMIFITHRFGHLTKHADLILCMKEGELVEQGAHAELVALRGEYFDLYNVQAQAFTTDEQKHMVTSVEDSAP